MTNAEAIKAIKAHCYFANLKDEAKEALDLAIEALSEPTIPLSVIEDISKQLEELINKPCTNQNMMAQNLAYRNVQEMIKKHLGEVTHEEN